LWTCARCRYQQADAVVDLFWAEFRAVAGSEATEGIDGVFLVLHGAMVSE
jgi:microcystin degradation protein MlrC